MSSEELQRLVMFGRGTAVHHTLGFVLPPLVPLPSHHLAPFPSIRWPAAPTTLILVPETEIRGPCHSLYPNVVVPWKVTVVPSWRLVKSRVDPAGTVMSLMTIEVQAALLLMTEAQSVNVQAPRLAGAAATNALALSIKEAYCIATMMNLS